MGHTGLACLCLVQQYPKTIEQEAPTSNEGGCHVDAISWCTSKNLMSGYGSQFGTGDSVTREQFAAMLYRFAEYDGKNVLLDPNKINNFSDKTEISTWATDAMNWTVTHGFMVGTGGKLLPQGNITRAEVAVMLQTYHNMN